MIWGCYGLVDIGVLEAWPSKYLLTFVFFVGYDFRGLK